MACKHNQNSVLRPSPYPWESGGLTDAEERKLEECKIIFGFSVTCCTLTYLPFFFYCTTSFCLPSTSLHLQHPKACACSLAWVWRVSVLHDEEQWDFCSSFGPEWWFYCNMCWLGTELKENLAIGHTSNFLKWDLAERNFSRCWQSEDQWKKSLIILLRALSFFCHVSPILHEPDKIIIIVIIWAKLILLYLSYY